MLTKEKGGGGGNGSVCSIYQPTLKALDLISSKFSQSTRSFRSRLVKITIVKLAETPAPTLYNDTALPAQRSKHTCIVTPPLSWNNLWKKWIYIQLSLESCPFKSVEVAVPLYLHLSASCVCWGAFEVERACLKGAPSDLAVWSRQLSQQSEHTGNLTPAMLISFSLNRFIGEKILRLKVIRVLILMVN